MYSKVLGYVIHFLPIHPSSQASRPDCVAPCGDDYADTPARVPAFMKCTVVPLMARIVSTISFPSGVSHPSPVRVTCVPSVGDQFQRGALNTERTCTSPLQQLTGTSSHHTRAREQRQPNSIETHTRMQPAIETQATTDTSTPWLHHTLQVIGRKKA